MLRTFALAVVAVLVVGCSGGDDDDRPLLRIEGPAEVDPEFQDGGETDDRSGSGG